MFSMGHKKRFLRHAVTDNRTIKTTKTDQNDMKPFSSRAVSCDCEEQTQIQAFIRRSSSPIPSCKLSSDRERQSPRLLTR